MVLNNIKLILFEVKMNYLENIIETTSERIKYVDERKNNFET